MSDEKKKDIKQEFIRLLKYAPPEMRVAILGILPAAKRTLNAGYKPQLNPDPLKSWRCLLHLLSSVATLQGDTETLLRVSNDLLRIADRMVPPDEVLRQSAEILVHALHAEMYVCRMRTSEGLWVTRAAGHVRGEAVPIVAPYLDENLLRHPVMHAVMGRHARYVVTNNLRGMERGGGSLDCMVYQEGYRSRLAFVLRERSDRPAFGLLQLYTKQEFGFENHDEHFLAKCARIVSLIVGRRVAVARDTLEKAAGAMAHYGNNALNVMNQQAEYCAELLEDIDNNLSRALRLSREVLTGLPREQISEHLLDTAQELEAVLAREDLTELAAHLGGVMDGIKRMTRIIHSLKKSVERPHLIRYALGHSVLELDDGRPED